MSDRKSHWENVYAEKSPLDVSWYQKEPTVSLELIRETGIARDEAIIDVGGGASVLVDRLREEGYSNLAVLDISENALISARKRLGEAAEKIEWFAADITDFDVPHSFSVWHDRAVFHFLTDASDRKEYVDVLSRALRPGGHLIIAAFAIGGPEACSGLDIVQYDAGKLSVQLGPGFALLEERSEVHVTPANAQQQFIYFRFTRNTP